MIREATVDDLDDVRAVERAAGEPFRSVDMALVADADVPSRDELTPFVTGHRAWVADEAGVIAGFVLAQWVDGCGHVEQVSVDPRHRGRRIGSALVDRVAAWAAVRGAPALTLTTFRSVPWNGPYYLSLGFRWLTDDDLTPGLRDIRSHEAALGLDRWPRGCMRRELPGAGSVTRDGRAPAAD